MKDREKSGKKKRNITYSPGFKAALFMVLAVSVAVGVLSAYAGAYLVNYGAYTGTYQEYRYEAFQETALKHLVNVSSYYAKLGDITAACNRDSEENGVGYSIKFEGYRLWTNCEDVQTPLQYALTPHKRFSDGDGSLVDSYTFIIYVYEDFSKMDEFWMINLVSSTLYSLRYHLPIIVCLCVLCLLISFVWLLCNAGRRRDREGITPGVLTPIPLDILTAVFAVAAFVMVEGIYNTLGVMMPGEMIISVALSSLTAVWCTIFLREFVRRVRLGGWWKNSLIYRVLRLIRRFLCMLGKGAKALVLGLPMIYHIVAVVVLVTGCNFLGVLGLDRVQRVVWLICETLVIVPVILYCALAFKKLQKGSKALAEGNLSRKLDTRYLVLDFGEFAGNLNRISDGISRAVEQRMRSERLKTELITNVSHDIKTPLTSVINYADLLGSEAGSGEGDLDREKVAEYAEVLVRQSKRLKKLLDDLLEASKANTGSLEVNLTPCALGVLLTQAAGEYEARFAERGLDLRIRQPEEEIRIMADGRHLWRVFDNLLGNIWKYAQEGSRVYLDMERTGDHVQIVFRNMSEYELNISPEELEERFVRGDKSRNREGNGLGLSIAKSLVELQNGIMRIVTDGDLFKVILCFSVLQ